jgi:hypothetical protein
MDNKYCVAILNGIFIVILTVFMLNVVMLGVIMLSAVVPWCYNLTSADTKCPK